MILVQNNVYETMLTNLFAEENSQQTLPKAQLFINGNVTMLTVTYYNYCWTFENQNVINKKIYNIIMHSYSIYHIRMCKLYTYI